MAKLRHIALTVPDPKKAAEFYEIKYRDPNGVVVDITANGWAGAAKDTPEPGPKTRRPLPAKRASGRKSVTRD